MRGPGRSEDALPVSSRRRGSENDGLGTAAVREEAESEQDTEETGQRRRGVRGGRLVVQDE